MTTDVFYLTLTAVLAACLWIPYIVGVNMNATAETRDFRVPVDKTLFPAWVRRADRAHMNLIEQFLPMAVVVMVAAVTGTSNAVTGWAVAAFFWLRVIHAAGMISGKLLYPLRPVVFSAGWACILVVAWQVLSAA